MGWECGMGKTSAGQMEEFATLEEEEADWLAILLANLPVTGSLYGLLIEKVAKGNQERKQERNQEQKRRLLACLTGAAG